MKLAHHSKHVSSKNSINNASTLCTDSHKFSNSVRHVRGNVLNHILKYFFFTKCNEINVRPKKISFQLEKVCMTNGLCTETAEILFMNVI